MSKPRDTAGLSGPRFLNLCEHFAAYQGALRNAAMRWQEQHREHEADTPAQLMLDDDLEVTRG